MNITALLENYHVNSAERKNDINDFVTRALVHLIQYYILPMTSSIVLTLSCHNEHNRFFYKDMLGNLLQNGPVQVQIIDMSQKANHRVAGRRHFNLILTDTYEAFRDTDIVSYTRNYNYNEYYYIVLQQDDYLLPDTMQRIFEYCWQHQLINCNVQVQLPNGTVNIYSYFPFTANHCGHVEATLINSYKVLSGGGLHFPILFPRKLRNFYGCTLRVAAWHTPPFFSLKRVNNELNMIGGVEGALLNELARRLNFSISMKIPPRNEQRGEIRNGLANGALGMLQRHEVDLTLGNIRIAPDRSELLTSTMSHYETNLVIVLYAPAYVLTSLDILFYALKVRLWLALLATILLCCILLIGFDVIFRQLQQTSHFISRSPCLNVWRIVVGIPLTAATHSTAKRLMIIGFIFFSLTIRTIYQGLLFQFMHTEQTSYMPMQIDELLRDNYSVYMGVIQSASFKAIPSVQGLSRIVLSAERGDGNDDDFRSGAAVPLLRLAASADKRHAAAVALDILNYFAPQLEQGQLAQAFRVVAQPVVKIPLTTYLTKHSFLVDEFEYQILWLRACGMFVAWRRNEIGDEAQQHQQQQQEQQSNEVSLGMRKLHAIFYLLFVGAGLSILVFIVELVTFRLQTLKGFFAKAIVQAIAYGKTKFKQLDRRQYVASS